MAEAAKSHKKLLRVLSGKCEQLAGKWRHGKLANVELLSLNRKMLSISLCIFPNISHVFLPVFRKLSCWTWTSSRSSGGSPPCSWGTHCRTAVRPQESPWWQIQPHPGLNLNHTLPPYPTYIWTHLFCFFPNKEPHLICLYHGKPIWCPPDTSLLHIPSALFWYLLFENCFVLFLLFVYFDRSTLCISMYMIQSLPLHPVMH